MRLIGFFIALALGAAAFFVALQFGGDTPSAPQKPQQVIVEKPKVIIEEVAKAEVFVARQDIPIGTILTQAMLDRQPWPKHLMIEGMITADQSGSQLEGMVVRTPFKRGEPIIREKLANKDDPSFLAASLSKGMRAVTVATDAIAGVAGFIFPGDRVDILITHDVPIPGETDERGRPITQKISEVLLPNVKVLAINQRATGKGGEGPQVPSSASLEVSPQDGQKLRLAERNGALSLALRSLEDVEGEEDLARPIGIGDLTRTTPPAYFPLLYNDAGYVPPTIGIGVEEDENGEEIVDAPPPEGFETDSKNTVTIVRGAETEIIEVERP